MMENDFLDNIGNDRHTDEQIVEAILNGVVTFKKLQSTGEFDHSRQKSVKSKLNQKDDEAYALAISIIEIQAYLSAFPEGKNVEEANLKIQRIIDNEERIILELGKRERMLNEIKQNINAYTPDEIIEKLTSDDLDKLCNELELDSSLILNYDAPPLRFNDIPESENEIPLDYTDVFFWGIPSSGKTCALSAILSTIKKDYSMEEPDCEIKFGSIYRTSLVNIFHSDYGYLPGRTNEDRTQYMPFLFYKRGERNKRRISFFELSGEVFKYFYEKVNNTKIISNNHRESIEKSFDSLELLLNSNNQKIHFFFIDYNQETKHTIDDIGLTQDDYLGAAAVYFRDNNNILKKKTDAVYVIVTKSDEIKSETITRVDKARSFLENNFGNFMDVMKNQCDTNSIDFDVKLFSIGDVFFKRICKINREYSKNIIDDLLDRVRPINNNRLRKFFNS